MIFCAFFFGLGITVGFLLGALVVTREAMREAEFKQRIWRRYGRGL